MSNRSNEKSLSNTSSSRHLVNNKENVAPKPQAMPQIKRLSSRSHHEQDFHVAKNQFATQQPPEHTRTVSYETQPLKVVNIEFDMLCDE